MALLGTTVTDLAADAKRVRDARYGVIECAGGQFIRLRLRPWPTLVSVDEVLFWGRLSHHFTRGDRCRVFYNQPLGSSNYLALKYALSSRDCTLPTMLRALAMLDQVAWLKQSDAIVCDAWNRRVSDRSMARYGWEAHLQGSWHRHYIKRFYGHYPRHAQVPLDPRPAVCQPVA
jgi:hypothetical protein